jgi:hypothetical protein
MATKDGSHSTTKTKIYYLHNSQTTKIKTKTNDAQALASTYYTTQYCNDNPFGGKREKHFNGAYFPPFHEDKRGLYKNKSKVPSFLLT